MATIQSIKFDEEHGVFDFEWTEEMKVWIKYDKKQKAIVVTSNRSGYKMLAQIFLSLSEIDANKEHFHWHMDARAEKWNGDLEPGSNDTILEVIKK
jgi:hypothetical protein